MSIWYVVVRYVDYKLNISILQATVKYVDTICCSKICRLQVRVKYVNITG
jgi:hypothetical protein